MGRMNGDMMMVAVCQEFGWTYDEYMDSPTWFLEMVREKLIRDNKETQRQTRP